MSAREENGERCAFCGLSRSSHDALERIDQCSHPFIGPGDEFCDHLGFPLAVPRDIDWRDSTERIRFLEWYLGRNKSAEVQP